MVQKFSDIDAISLKVQKVCCVKSDMKKSSRAFKAAFFLHLSSYMRSISHTKQKKVKKGYTFNSCPKETLDKNLLKGIQDAQKCCDDQSFRLEYLRKILLEGHIQVHQISSYKPVDLKNFHEQLASLGVQMKVCLQKKTRFSAHKLKKNLDTINDPYLMMSKKKGDLKIM